MPRRRRGPWRAGSESTGPRPPRGEPGRRRCPVARRRSARGRRRRDRARERSPSGSCRSDGVLPARPDRRCSPPGSTTDPRLPPCSTRARDSGAPAAHRTTERRARHPDLPRWPRPMPRARWPGRRSRSTDRRSRHTGWVVASMDITAMAAAHTPEDARVTVEDSSTSDLAGGQSGRRDAGADRGRRRSALPGRGGGPTRRGAVGGRVV